MGSGERISHRTRRHLRDRRPREALQHPGTFSALPQPPGATASPSRIAAPGIQLRADRSVTMPAAPARSERAEDGRAANRVPAHPHHMMQPWADVRSCRSWRSRRAPRP
jgi:hypothetical protein